MEMNTFYKRPRLIFLAFISIAIWLAILFNYGKYMIQTNEAVITSKLFTERGSILDRNGKILASQTTLYNIAVTRSAVLDKQLCAQILAPIISIEEQDLLSRLDATGNNFFYLKRRISENEKNAVEDALSRAGIRGIRLEPVISRTWPENRLASHVIGFLGDDGRGLSGIEYSYQDILSPQTTDNSGTQRGFNILLTIDSNIQYEMEKIARTTKTETQAEAVILLAADARTGEILAYVSEPSANLNAYAQSESTERMDRPALYAFEPGSVFKIFSLSAMLDMGIIHDEQRFYCDGEYTHTTGRGERISIKCLSSHGWVTPRDVIRLSCNDGTGQMVEKAQADLFEQKIRNFGFGSKTGIELPGETVGILRPSSSWSGRSKATIAIGQELSVSALHMLKAATALTNGGVPLKPTLISRIYTGEGQPVHEHRPVQLQRVLSPETARLMLDYMQTTSLTGTGTRAAVGDVPMAVKTGTAQMLDSSGSGYSTSDFISSCIGIFPATNPQIILYLAIIKPVGETYGGRIAAPVVSKAANSIIDYLGLGRGQAPSILHPGIIPVQKNEPVELGSVMPDLTGISKRMLTGVLNRRDLTVIIEGDGYVVSQEPPAGTSLSSGTRIHLVLE